MLVNFLCSLQSCWLASVLLFFFGILLCFIIILTVNAVTDFNDKQSFQLGITKNLVWLVIFNKLTKKNYSYSILLYFF